MLKQGLIKRIGEGEQTDPWKDRRLPRDGMSRSIACRVAEPPALVADFVDDTSATWNFEKLQQCLLLMDVETILQIPLSHRRQEDFGFGTMIVRVSCRYVRHTKCL